jgi:hypothetical protein
MAGFAGTGLGARGALSGFAAGASGTDPVTSPGSAGRERGTGGWAASRFAGDVTPKFGARPGGVGWPPPGTSAGGKGAASE